MILLAAMVANIASLLILLTGFDAVDGFGLDSSSSLSGRLASLCQHQHHDGRKATCRNPGTSTLLMAENDWRDDYEEDDEEPTKKATMGWGWDSKATSTTKQQATNDNDAFTTPNRNVVDGFNPLRYDASKHVTSPTMEASSKTARIAGKSAQISLRATQMQELNRALLDAVGTSDIAARQTALTHILRQYRDFLLEPLEDVSTVLDGDSIYTPQMSRAERFQAYRTSMNERIESSQNLKVKAVLQAMRDFVLEFE